jgi:hypothetical protein
MAPGGHRGHSLHRASGGWHRASGTQYGIGLPGGTGGTGWHRGHHRVAPGTQHGTGLPGGQWHRGHSLHSLHRASRGSHGLPGHSMASQHGIGLQHGIRRTGTQPGLATGISTLGKTPTASKASPNAWTSTKVTPCASSIPERGNFAKRTHMQGTGEPMPRVDLPNFIPEPKGRGARKANARFWILLAYSAQPQDSHSHVSQLQVSPLHSGHLQPTHAQPDFTPVLATLLPLEKYPNAITTTTSSPKTENRFIRSSFRNFVEN